jgi:hypothetical protein
MAFTDVLIGESDADVVMVDRRHRPGGHWNDAYPFVRIHQPSAAYGVASRPLGHDRIDVSGPNAGFYERATASELCDYYGRVLDEHFARSGQVRFIGMHDYLGGRGGEHHLRSRLTGAVTTVGVRRRLVDATYLESSLPSTHSPSFAVDPDAMVVAPNGLVSLAGQPSGFTVVGAGKTGMDSCCWLVDNGVDPDRIRWIRPRDAWIVDRASIQPLALVEGVATWMAGLTEAGAAATDLGDLWPQMEDAGALARLDTQVEATFFRGAILSAAERATLGSIGEVVRMGHVRRVGVQSIELDEGSIRSQASHVTVDCTAAGLSCSPNRPVFEEGRITPQFLQLFSAPFGAAVIGWAEANRDDDMQRNRLCRPCGLAPEADARSLARQWATTLRTAVAWTAEPDLRKWVGTCRLNPLANARQYMTAGAANALARMEQRRDAAIANLERLAAPDATAPR